MKKNVDVNLLYEIISNERITQEQFAKSLSYSKQYIWNILNGVRKISTDFTQRVENAYPQYLDKSISIELNTIAIPYNPEIKLPVQLYCNNKQVIKISFDKRLLPDYPVLNLNALKVVSVATDSMKPEIKYGDKVLIDESYTYFVDNQIFAFTYGNTCYLRRINVLPDKIKCISLDEKEDTFYLDDMNKVNIIGLIVPQIRL